MGDKSQEMIKELSGYGTNHGFVALQESVVIVGPGSPFSVHSTCFGKADLEQAIKAGLFERCKLIGSVNLHIYAVKQK